MKICLLADAPSIHTQKWARYFAQRGHKVDVISFRPAKIENVGVHFIGVSEVSYKGGISNWRYLLKIGLIKDLVKNEVQPDLVHAHYLTSYGFIGSFTGFHPYVVTAHGSDVLMAPEQSFLLRFFVNRTISNADLITSPAHHVSEKLLALGASNSRIITIQYGVDLEEVKRKRINRRNNLIISTRAFEPLYNLTCLLFAVPIVIKRIPQAEFILVGDGSQRESLENLAEKLGMQNHIRFLGKISHTEVIKYLLSSPVYVSTSLSDSTSMALLEAMACGSFPVVTDIAGNREWIQDNENGFLVPPNDSQLLAEKIIEALKRERLRMMAEVRNIRIIKERASYRWNMRVIEEKYIELVRTKSKQ